MTSKHTARTELTFFIEPSSSEFERPIQVDFVYRPGVPAQCPTYDSGGQPAEPAQIEITSIRFTDNTTDVLPDWLIEALSNDRDIIDWLGDEAMSDRAAMAEARAEMREDA